VGNEFEIIPHTSQNENHHPSVIFNPHTNGYALAWDRTEGIAIALLDSAGKLTGSILPVMRNPGPNGYYDDWGEEHDGRDGHYYPRVLGLAYHPASDKLLLVFQQRFSPTEGDYWLATLDPALNNFHSSDLARINKNTVSFISDPYWDLYHPGWGLSLVILPKGSALVYYADSESVKRRQIDSKGKPSGKAFPAFSGALKNAHLFYPNVAFSTISSGTTGLLIAAMPDSWPNKTALYGQSLNSRGRPIGRPILLDHSDAFELVALPRNDSDKVLQYEYFQFGGELNPALCSGYCMSVVKVDVEVIP